MTVVNAATKHHLMRRGVNIDSSLLLEPCLLALEQAKNAGRRASVRFFHFARSLGPLQWNGRLIGAVNPAPGPLIINPETLPCKRCNQCWRSLRSMGFQSKSGASIDLPTHLAARGANYRNGDFTAMSGGGCWCYLNGALQIVCLERIQ